MTRSLTTGRYPTDTAVAQEMIAEIERELAVRIRPMIAHWPEEEIVALLRQMAEIRYKYEGSAAVHWQ